MFRGLQKRWSERRHGYSFRGHLRRVVSEKGLRHVVLSLGGTALVLSGAFAYCGGGSSITGPSVSGPQSPRSGGLSPSATSPSNSVSAEKKAVAVFPTDLLPKIHPCDPDVTFTEMSGQREIIYTDEILYDANGQPTGEHRIREKTTDSQNGRDNKGRHYGKTKKEEKSFFMQPGKSQNFVSHYQVEGENPCTTTYNSGSAQGDNGQDCTRSFDSKPSYEYLLIEDPLTREGTLVVTTTSILSTCPTTLGMRPPALLAMR